MLKKTNLFHPKHAHHDEVVGELLNLFARGIAVTKGGSLALAGCAMAVLSPLGILAALPGHTPRLTVVALLWWCIKEPLQLGTNAAHVFLIAGIFAVFFRDLERSVSEAATGIAVAGTGGRIVKFLCAKYLERNPFAQSVLESNNNSHAITALASVLEPSHRRQYEDLLAMYLASDTKEGKADLLDRLSTGRGGTGNCAGTLALRDEQRLD